MTTVLQLMIIMIIVQVIILQNKIQTRSTNNIQKLIIASNSSQIISLNLCASNNIIIMSKTGRAAFGIQKLNRRYSIPNNLKGAKISAEKMNRTMSLKLKKINEVKSARSHNELLFEQQMSQMIKDQQPAEPRQFFRTYHRIYKAQPMKNKPQLQNNSLFFDVKYPKRNQIQQEQVHQGRPVYFSSNLQEKKNLYLNGLLNRGEQQQINQKKDIQIKLSQQPMVRKQSLNLQNLFWRKMKRMTSQRKQDTPKQSNL